MSDIVTGLYDRAIGADGDALLMDAADEIERLRADRERILSDYAEANAEIEKLRWTLDLRTREAHTHVLALQQKDGLLLDQEEEIERIQERTAAIESHLRWLAECALACL